MSSGTEHAALTVAACTVREAPRQTPRARTCRALPARDGRLQVTQRFPSMPWRRTGPLRRVLALGVLGVLFSLAAATRAGSDHGSTMLTGNEFPMAIRAAERPRLPGSRAISRPYLAIPIAVATRLDVPAVSDLLGLAGKWRTVALDVAATAERNDSSRRGTPGRSEPRLSDGRLWQMLILLAVVVLPLVVWNRVLARQIQTRKDEAAALSASEQRYRGFVECADDTVFSLSPAGILTYVSPNSLELFGVPAADMEGKPFEPYVHPDDVSACREFLERGLATGERLASLDYRALHRDGSLRWHSVKGSALRGRDGHVTGYLGIVRDITERKRMEEGLKVSEGRVRSVLETMALIGLMLDTAGNVTFCNDFLLKLTGWTREEVLGHDWFARFLSPEVRRQLKEEVFLCTPSGGGVPAHYRNEIVTRTGERRMVAWNNSILRDHSGNIAGVACIGEDITERLQAEAALRDAETRYRLLFEHAPEGVVIIDPATARPLEFNETAHRQLGYSREEFARLSIADLEAMETPEETRSRIARVIREGRNDFETRHRTRKGEIRDVHVTAQFIEMKGKPVYHCIWRDITDRKRAEAQRDVLEEQLRQAQKMESVGRLAGGVAHDFNNLLMGIMGYTEMCRDALPSDHPIREWLGEISRDAQRSADITRQLLAFARKQAISPKVLDLNDSLAGMLKMLRHLIGEDIELVWMPGANLWPVRVDPSQVDQILANLSVNARDAIAGVGKLTIETANITLDEVQCASYVGAVAGDYVALAVSDDGCGMDKDVLEHLFEPFFTTKEVGKGTGLGLATVYGIATQNNGFVNVYSEPGRGTTFKVYLPRFPGAVKEATVGDDRADAPRGHGETVLLVEDEKSVRVTTCRFLERLGYTVLVAEAPAEALRLAAAHVDTIHLLITDLVMPGMSGRELAERLAAQRPEIKCLFMSGYTANVIAQSGVLDECTHFLSKPFSRTAIADKVREILAS